jgi:hypothetical protein
LGAAVHLRRFFAATAVGVGSAAGVTRFDTFDHRTLALEIERENLVRKGPEAGIEIRM